MVVREAATSPMGISPSITTKTASFPGGDEEKYRLLDRVTRWHAFLYATHKGHHEIITSVYGDVEAHTAIYQTAKTKIMENIKAYKGQVLTAVTVGAFMTTSSTL